MSRIRFHVVPPVATAGEPVYVSGNRPALGDWDPLGALPLEWRPPFYVGEIPASQGDHLEFKITRGSWETEEVDAWGSVPENHTFDVYGDATARAVVADWKDRYTGRLVEDRCWSKIFAASRELLVWLPPGYGRETSRRYPVWILSDGRNVFDPKTSPISGVDLAADEWVRLLAEEGAMPETIVVAVCHPEGFAEGTTSQRDSDLSPELGGDAFGEFLAAELVPYVDAHYRTLAEKDSRILSGVSLGGLNALQSALAWPGAFGKVMALSASFEDVSLSPPGECAALSKLRALEPLPEGLRVFLDYGTSGLDECYEPYFREVGSILRTKGWRDDRQFKILRVIGATHDELSWRNRIGDGLRFLCGNEFR